MRSLWSWLTWANFEHVQKNRSEDVSELERSKDSVETWKQRHWQYKPNVVFIDVVQTWYGRKSLHYVPTAFLLRHYYVNYVTTIVSRFCQGKGTFIPCCIGQHYVCSTFIWCLTRPLYQVLFASMARPAIKYKYFTEFLTFPLVFQLLSWNT